MAGHRPALSASNKQANKAKENQNMEKQIKSAGILLEPPGPGVCQVCAKNHPAGAPHNRDSIYYQYYFALRHNRWPSWRDAMAHCPKDIQDQWTEALEARGIDVNEEKESQA